MLEHAFLRAEKAAVAGFALSKVRLQNVPSSECAFDFESDDMRLLFNDVFFVILVCCE